MRLPAITCTRKNSIGPSGKSGIAVAGDLPIADVLSKLMISAHTLSDTMISSMMTSPIGERFERPFALQNKPFRRREESAAAHSFADIVHFGSPEN
jgi:hypothetical protein